MRSAPFKEGFVFRYTAYVSPSDRVNCTRFEPGPAVAFRFVTGAGGTTEECRTFTASTIVCRKACSSGLKLVGIFPIVLIGILLHSSLRQRDMGLGDLDQIRGGIHLRELDLMLQPPAFPVDRDTPVIG